MRLCLLARLVVLLGSLSLAVPAWAASFGSGDDPHEHRRSGLRPAGVELLGVLDRSREPDALRRQSSSSASGETLTYTLTDGECTPVAGQIACGLPPGLTLTGREPSPARWPPT